MTEKLYRFFPEARIDILVRKGNESLFVSHPHISTCLIWDKKENKYRNLFSLLKRIRQTQYDAVINLQRFAASGLLTAFSGAEMKIGFDKNPLSFLFTVTKKHVIGNRNNPGKHEVERCLSLLDNLTDTSPQKPKLFPSPDDFEVIRDYTQTPFVTVSPASVWFTKQVPENQWLLLIDALKSHKIYLLGAAQDKALCQKLCMGNVHVVSLAGELSLLQSAALMSKAIMNYTSDSAPMHLCSAMNAPVTAVFCSTIPEFGFGPLSDRSFVVETTEKLDCRPCGLHGHRECPQGHFKCGILHLERAASNVNRSEA